MRRFGIAALTAGALLAMAGPAAAQWGGGFSVGIGVGPTWGGGYYGDSYYYDSYAADWSYPSYRPYRWGAPGFSVGIGVGAPAYAYDYDTYAYEPAYGYRAWAYDTYPDYQTFGYRTRTWDGWRTASAPAEFTTGVRVRNVARGSTVRTRNVAVRERTMVNTRVQDRSAMRANARASVRSNTAIRGEMSTVGRGGTAIESTGSAGSRQLRNSSRQRGNTNFDEAGKTR